MEPCLSITASCIIRNHIVYQNGNPIFENKDADLRQFLLSVYQQLNVKYPKFYKMDTLSKLGWLAAEVLMSAGFQSQNYRAEDIGVVLANASSSLDTDLAYFETTKEMASPALFVYTLPNIVVGEICIRNQFKGENAFFISDKFDVDFLEKYVTMLLAANALQVCICGWVEVLEEAYEAALFLVEKTGEDQSTLFTKEIITKLYRNE